MQNIYSTATAAEQLRLEEWQVRRLFENGDLPEPQKFGGKRLIDRRLLVRIRAAAVRRGWLEPDTPATAK